MEEAQVPRAGKIRQVPVEGLFLGAAMQEEKY